VKPVKRQQFAAVAAATDHGGILIPVPFDPDTVWGPSGATTSAAR
jgi:hypothetical protein